LDPLTEDPNWLVEHRARVKYASDLEEAEKRELEAKRDENRFTGDEDELYLSVCGSSGHASTQHSPYSSRPQTAKSRPQTAKSRTSTASSQHLLFADTVDSLESLVCQHNRRADECYECKMLKNYQ